MFPSACLFVLHAHTLVGRIPDISCLIFHDAVDTTVYQRLVVEILVLYNLHDMTYRDSHINTTRVRPHPDITKTVCTDTVYAVPVKRIIGFVFGIEEQPRCFSVA